MREGCYLGWKSLLLFGKCPVSLAWCWALTIFGGSQAVMSSQLGKNQGNVTLSPSSQQCYGANKWGRTCNFLCRCSPATKVLSLSSFPFISSRCSILISQQKACCSLDNLLWCITSVVFTLSNFLCLVKTHYICMPVKIVWFITWRDEGFKSSP